jgi:tetratricopeptide (TPR) repeat protein
MADEALFARGRRALDLGQYDEARRLFDQHELLLGTQDETKALLASGEARTAAGDVGGAARDFQRALERNPGLAQAWIGQARLALFTGDGASARTHATAATKLDPSLGAGWTMLGLVHEAEGDSMTALELLGRGAEGAPSSFFGQFNLGRVLASVRRFEEAVPVLRRAIALEPKNAAGHETLAIALERWGRLDEAVAAREAVVALLPTNVEAWAALVDLHFGRKALGAALKTAERGLAAGGESPILLEKAIACAMLRDDLEGAVRLLERELKVAPHHERAWLNLANLSILSGDVPRAERLARAFVQQHPARWEGHFLLANLLEGTGRLDDALVAYRAAVAYGPTEWRPHVNLGAALVQHADPAFHREAVEVLTTALRLVPVGEWRALYNLALAKVRVGARDEALALARRIEAEAPPDSSMAAEAQRLRRNLGA